MHLNIFFINKIHFLNFFFRKFCPILFDFILFLKKFENFFVMNSVHLVTQEQY